MTASKSSRARAARAQRAQAGADRNGGAAGRSSGTGTAARTSGNGTVVKAGAPVEGGATVKASTPRRSSHRSHECLGRFVR